MPYLTRWMPNELFLEHKGVRIFHTYNNDEEMIRTHFYGTASDTRDADDDTNFDVRDLPTWEAQKELLEKEADRETEKADRCQNAIRSAIIAAIEAGHLQKYIRAAKDRPTDVPEGNPFTGLIGVFLENGHWKFSIEAASINLRISFSITEAEKTALENAGIGPKYV